MPELRHLRYFVAVAEELNLSRAAWSLHRWCTEATNAAWRGKLAGIVWHFQLS